MLDYGAVDTIALVMNGYTPKISPQGNSYRTLAYFDRIEPVVLIAQVVEERVSSSVGYDR